MRSIAAGSAFPLLLALSLLACDSESNDSVVAPATPSRRERPQGALTWSPCGELECATLEVPINADDPALGTLSLALNRVRAPQAYRGIVLVNPGGPGGSGLEFVQASAAALPVLFPGFDFIGFDPRGVGASTPLPCTLGDADAVPFSEAGVAGYLSSLQAASRRCAEEAGPLFANMGSHQVVADMDRIRIALGEEELNFLGISYGTRLGELYAMTYPEHARAVVLDAPMPPVGDSRLLAQEQFEGLLEQHSLFFADCASGVLDCPENPEAVFQQLVDDARADDAEEGLLSAWKLFLSSAPGRDFCALLLRIQAGEAPDELPPDMPMPEDLIPMVDEAANFSVLCADDGQPVLSVEEGDALLASYAERSPLFASQGLAALNCSGWDVPRDPVPLIQFTPRLPVLVIGGVRDVLTPYELAQQTAQQLERSVLLTSEHYGHSAITSGSLCVLLFIRNYLDTLRLPPEGARCPAP